LTDDGSRRSVPHVVAIEAPHHITQRGNARQTVFEGDPDRLVYLDLLCQHCRLGSLKLIPLKRQGLKPLGYSVCGTAEAVP